MTQGFQATDYTVFTSVSSTEIDFFASSTIFRRAIRKSRLQSSRFRSSVVNRPRNHETRRDVSTLIRSRRTRYSRTMPKRTISSRFGLELSGSTQNRSPVDASYLRATCSLKFSLVVLELNFLRIAA